MDTLLAAIAGRTVGMALDPVRIIAGLLIGAGSKSFFVAILGVFFLSVLMFALVAVLNPNFEFTILKAIASLIASSFWIGIGFLVSTFVKSQNRDVSGGKHD